MNEALATYLRNWSDSLSLPGAFQISILLNILKFFSSLALIKLIFSFHQAHSAHRYYIKRFYWSFFCFFGKIQSIFEIFSFIHLSNSTDFGSYNVIKSSDTLGRVRCWKYLLNLKPFDHETWPTNKFNHWQYF